MKKIAIITARGGSKRILKKNIKDFCGRPIIEYSINAALNAHIFDEVMVSTDDYEIKKEAERCGANVPFLRSKYTSDDYATTAEVLQEVISEYKKRNIEFVYGCCIYPTAPFITSDKLKNAMEILIEEDVNTVMPVVEFSYPPQRGYKIEDNNLRMIDETKLNVRSQDLEKIYHDCGQFYCFEVENLISNGNIIGDRVRPIIYNNIEVQDIDDINDWYIAEMKYKLLNNKENK